MAVKANESATRVDDSDLTGVVDDDSGMTQVDDSVEQNQWIINCQEKYDLKWWNKGIKKKRWFQRFSQQLPLLMNRKKYLGKCN